MDKKEKTTKNPKNTDDKCFLYAATFALNYGEIETHSKIVSNIKPFKKKYNWEEINYPSTIDIRKLFDKNNPTIALKVLCAKEKRLYPAYISKINANCEKQVILLMIRKKEKEGL